MSPEPFEDVSWEKIFLTPTFGQKRDDKFTLPVKPLSWVSSYEANVHRTAEWLIRNGRIPERMHQEDLFITEIKDFWYHMDPEPGRFIHVCFPQELLQYRHKYGILYEDYVNLPFTRMSSEVISAKKRLTVALWAQWNCLGGDGYFSTDKGENFMATLYVVDGKDQKRTYANKCNKCQLPLPRGIKIFADMQYGGFKDV